MEAHVWDIEKCQLNTRWVERGSKAIVELAINLVARELEACGAGVGPDVGQSAVQLLEFPGFSGDAAGEVYASLRIARG